MGSESHLGSGATPSLSRSARPSVARSAKVLKGFGGGGVVEIVEDHEGEAYRCVYTVRLERAVYVLHAFKKKSKRESKRRSTTWT